MAPPNQQNNAPLIVKLHTHQKPVKLGIHRKTGRTWSLIGITDLRQVQVCYNNCGVVGLRILYVINGIPHESDPLGHMTGIMTSEGTVSKLPIQF